MPNRVSDLLCSLLAALLLGGAAVSSCWASEPAGADEVAILQIRVIEGEGAVHAAGSRSPLPLTVQVTDETGQPVEGVAVSLQMPSRGASGVFASGLRSDVLLTDERGRVSVRGVRWGKTPGPARLRITAVKGRARAGIISTQYVETGGSGAKRASESGRHSVSKPHGKWIAIAVIAAGAAAGGLALGLSGKSSSPQPAAAAAAQTSSPGVQVGVPTITIGNP